MVDNNATFKDSINIDISMQQQESSRLDLSSLEGLRGVLCIWIMIFHCLIYSRSSISIDLQGSSLMPMFFILTGYQCAIAYQEIMPENISNEDNRSLIVNDSIIDKSQNKNRNDVWSFYQNRIARVLPVYILSNILILPLEFLGYLSFNPSLGASTLIAPFITTFTCTSTLFIFMFGSPFDGVTWTIQTFLLLWLLFPIAMRYVRRIKHDRLINYIMMLYYTQMGLVFGLFFGTVSFLGFWPAFCLATMNPVTRIPLFFMGVVSGELINRCHSQNISISQFWLHGFLFPYTCSCDGMHELKMSHIWHLSNEDKNAMSKSDVEYWKTRGSTKSLFLLMFTIAVVIGNSFSPSSILGAVWLQAIVPYCQLEIVVSLTLDKGESLASKFLRNKMLQNLGKIGMTIYCLHYPIIYYLCFLLNHCQKVVWPPITDYNQCSDADCYSSVYYYNYQRTIPVWGVPIVVCATVLLSIPTFYIFEEPMRRLLQVKK